ncbi:Uncharacterised protein [Mycobacteroides abscessus subsp. abscessus]|nr:Uncharacterised protein [Mycobacteroides abscessus subsp. abscessus]
MRASSMPSWVTFMPSSALSSTYPRSASSARMRSKVRASELVAAATFFCSCALSRSMRR